MPVEVSFYATLRQIVGTKNVTFDLADGVTVRELLKVAGERYPGLDAVMWNPDGSLSDFVKVFIDGREIRHLDMLETRVPALAQVDVFPPVAGG